MKIERNETVWRGRAIDLSETSLDAEVVVKTIRQRDTDDSSTNLTIDCADLTLLHTHVGWITTEMTLQLRAALEAAARSRGQSAPQDVERARIVDQIDALPTATVETGPMRKRLAATNEEIDRQREQVARLQGQVQALRRLESGDVQEMLGTLERAIQKLSELETERAATKQALERERTRQRQLHDVRDKRLALEDRAANLARDARTHLIEQIKAEFETAVKTVPGATTTGSTDPVTTALAIARIGVIDAPSCLSVIDSVACRRQPTGWIHRLCTSEL